MKCVRFRIYRAVEAEYVEKLRQLRKDLEDSRQQTAKEIRVAEESAQRLEEMEAERSKMEEKMATLKEVIMNNVFVRRNSTAHRPIFDLKMVLSCDF